MEKTFSKQELRELSGKLLGLHRALIDFAKKDYEGKFGKIPNANKFLDLLMTDAEFAWLRALSGLIAGIDEIVDSKELALDSQVQDLITYTRTLLTGDEEGSEFSKKYFTAVQKDPGVALTHGKIMQSLRG